MYAYNPKSLKAEEFINHQEILDTLAYAEANKDNLELIDQIIEKANLCKGLTHREASVLLACENQEKIEELYTLAEELKKKFYGNRIVMFARSTSPTTASTAVFTALTTARTAISRARS